MDDLEEQGTRDVVKDNDQYCQYEKLPILLKRFSFEEKMRMATIHSSRAILFKPLLEKLEVTMMKRAPYRARDKPYN